MGGGRGKIRQAVSKSASTLGGDDTVSEVESTSGVYPSSDLKRGDSVGRYLILGVLGSGGMGSVYAAHDPKLDRKVAIKVVRPTARMRERFADARKRLFGEAQALARLSHPNVVSVHDVGAYDEGVFIAMEYVDGVTLRRWPDEAEPTWEQILDVFVAAGRGLAAAHDQDIVHRDFKPDNVMVDRSGRVCVLDFGLAVPEGEELATFEKRRGTPAYMAPERHNLQSSDARADQFSFCVALYEMIYQSRPFAGVKADEIAIQILRGRVRPPPAGPVPARIGKAIMRGLHRDPAERWPDMHQLIAALSGGSARHKRGLVVALGGLALTAMAAWGVMGGGADECEEARAPVDAVWGAEQRQAVSDALTAAKQPFAEVTAERALVAMDRYAAELGAAFTAVCATERSGRQPVQRACLSQRLAQLEATSTVFSTVDGVAPQFWMDAVTALSPVAYCDEADAAAFKDAIEHDRAAEILGELAKAQALMALGHNKDAEGLLRPLTEEVVELDWPGTEARVRLALAQLLSGQGDPDEALGQIRGSIEAAARAGSDPLLARALIEQAHHHALRGEADQALAVAPAARAALIRSGRGRESARLALTMGNAGFFAGKYDAAEKDYRDALRIAGEQRDVIAASAARLNLGTLLFVRGDYAGASATFQTEVDVATELFGEHHPRTVQQRTNVADTLLVTGRVDAARQIYEDALATYQKYEGPDLAELGRVEQHLAEALGQLGRRDEALVVAKRARKRLEKAYGRGHYVTATVAATLSELYRWEGDDEAAEAESRAAVEGLVAAVGAAHSGTAQARIQLARLQIRRGALDDAETQLASAQGAIELVNEQHPALVLLHMQWAWLHARKGRVAPATLAASRAYQLAQGPSGVPIDQAQAAHLRALVAALADPSDPAVKKFASEAEGLYEGTAPHPDTDVAGVRALRRDPQAAVREAFGELQRD